MNELKECTEKIFEDIKHIDEYGNEYWLARELQTTLDYKKWQKFINVIENAKIACEQSNFIIEDHITQVGKMINVGKGGKRKVEDYKLSRYACYLIAQNGDSHLSVVAVAELMEMFTQMALGRIFLNMQMGGEHHLMEQCSLPVKLEQKLLDILMVKQKF